ncbi:hypothetical protein QOZ80_8AG0633570 [Eleusine coracana subsp. coracana]|nr:hypothetical protein QOZ80_8AG0633570 [Eleusine coracana subsp. coracana]
MERELWLLCAILVASLLSYLNSTRRHRSRRQPPGPTPLPLIGNLLDLRGGNLHHALARLARVHGPVMRLELGLTMAVVVSTRDAAREAFTRHDRRLGARAVPDTARALGFSDRSMIWLPGSDPRWKTTRGVVAAHVFSSRSLEKVRGVRESKVRDLVSSVRRRAGEEVDVAQAVYGGVLGILSSSFFSTDDVVSVASAQGLREVMEELVECIAKPNVSDLFPFLRPLDLQGWRRWAAVRFEKVFRILDDIIDRRLAETTDASSEGTRGDFLDALLDLLNQGKISRDSLTTVLFDVFAAGSDTMALTVAWAMAELLHNPASMAKMRAEIEYALGGKETIEETDATSLPYLQAVVKEAMRLHPVAPLMLPYQATEDGVEIGGYAVPRGCTVIFNSWAIMRDPAAWERPDEFVPERWFQDGAAKMDFRGKEFEFVPFGSGRRLCPGLPLAERIVPFVLASLLHAFEWKLPNGMSAEQLDVSERFTTANVMAVPLKAVPIVITCSARNGAGSKDVV